MYDKFRHLLEINNETAYRVSKDTGIAQSILSEWKSGRSQPKLDKIQKIAEHFGVPIEYFIK